ncbi:MAG: hypothetical protein ABI623_04645 [bacterium]
MKKTKIKLSEREIDEIVIRQADNKSAWGKSVHLKAFSVVPISLSPKLIEKAKMIARRRRMKGYQVWMQQVIRDRLKEEGDTLGKQRFLTE